MGSQNCKYHPVETLRKAIKGGITAFQFREKGKGSLTGSEKVELGLHLRQICLEHHIPFFINDDIHLVEKLKADGIHVGQDDVSVNEIKEKYPNILIGLSISNERELKNSPLELIDYIGAGPIFNTTTKDDAKRAVGLTWIKTLKRKHPSIPLVAIGGINEENAHDVIEAGADGVAVISAITKAENIEAVVQQL